MYLGFVLQVLHARRSRTHLPACSQIESSPSSTSAIQRCTLRVHRGNNDRVAWSIEISPFRSVLLQATFSGIQSQAERCAASSAFLIRSRAVDSSIAGIMSHNSSGQSQWESPNPQSS